MRTALQRIHRILPPLLGTITIAAAGLLLAVDLLPIPVGRRQHDVLGALPLALIATAYLLHQSVLRPAPKELLKAVIVAAAFLFWAANQVWPEPFRAMLFNDIAIALFVLDVFLVIIGWPRTPPDEGFAERSKDLGFSPPAGDILRRPR
jgi:hypothetical protein